MMFKRIMGLETVNNEGFLLRDFGRARGLEYKF